MRNGVSDFSLANPIYAAATVTFYTVSAGAKTTTKATLYAGLSGTTTLANPQRLDSEGKFKQAVYVDAPVVATISGLSIADHDTGIIQAVLSAGSVADVLTSLAAGSGSSLVGFLPSGSGAVATQVQAALRNLFRGPESRGAVGDGATDDAAAINAEFAINNFVRLTPGKTYLIGSAIVPTLAKSWLDARGANIKLKNASNAHMLRLPDAVNDFTVEGGDWDGNKANQTTGGMGLTNALLGANSRLRIVNATIHDCYNDGIGWSAATTQYLIEMGNIVYNCGGAGVSHHDGILSLATVVGNIGYSNATHNIGSTSIMEHVSLVGNVGYNAGTADNLTAYNSAGKFITVVGNVGKDGANNGIHFGGDNLALVGNVVDNPAQYGIAVVSSGGAVSEGVVVASNVVNSSGAAGYWLGSVEGGAFGDNVSVDVATHGAIFDTSTKYIAGAGNVALRPVGNNGFRTQGCDDIAIGLSVSKGAGAAGFQFTDTPSYVAVGVISSYNASPFTESGTSANGVVVGINQHNNTAVTPTLVSAATRWADNINGGTSNLASASTITLPGYTRIVVLTGTTAINTITATYAGDVVRVKFDATASLVHGAGNLKLNGAANQSGTLNDVVELVCDGTSWFQVAPISVN